MTVKSQGWYADPMTVGAARYWDGRQWTDIVSWGGHTSHDPTPIAEIYRRVAAAEADVVAAFLDDAVERNLIDSLTLVRVRADLDRRSRPRAQEPRPSRPPASSPVASSGSSLPVPSRSKPVIRPPKIEPIRVEPGVVKRWWERTHEAVSSDLALHGLAYLGVLLMFAGVTGLIVFSFGDISAEFRTLTELLVPISLLVAGRYLDRRGSPTVSRALTLMGAGLVPLVALASVTDNAPLPPDVDGRALPVVHGVLSVVIAAGMFAIVRRRAGSTPLRFLVAPVVWIGAGLSAAIFRDEVPQGYDVPRADALQLGAVLAAIAVTVVFLERWRRDGALATATMAVALPTAGSLYVLELVLAGNEGWPIAATVLSGLAAVALVEIWAARFPRWSVTVTQVLVVAVAGARIGAHAPAAWTATATALILLALVEFAGWRRPTAVGAWIGLGAVAVAVVPSVSSAGAGSMAFGALAVWALWRHVAPPAWLPVVDRAGFVAASAATVAVAELWRFGDAGTAVLWSGAGVLLLAGAGRSWSRVREDLLWQWFTPAAAVTLSAVSAAVRWGDAPTAIAAGTGMAAAAIALSALDSGPRTWMTAAVGIWSAANLAQALELSGDFQAISLATLALALVVVALARDWPIAHQLAFIGHTLAIGAMPATDGMGWALTFVLGAATAGWLATVVVNERSTAVHVAWLRKATEGTSSTWATWVDDLPVLVSIGGATLTALLVADAGGFVATDDPWAVAVIAAASVVGAALVRLVPWRRAEPRVLAWATLLLSLWAAYVSPTTASEGSSWSVITSVALGIVVVVLARGPRPRAFGWVAWAEFGIVSVLVSERFGLAALWVDAVLISWGAVVLLGSLLVDRRANGPARSGTFVRQGSLLAPASLGIVAIGAGAITGFAGGTTTEIGWMMAGLAVVALAAALLLSLGVLAGLFEALAVASLVLLAPWKPIDHPWSIVLAGVAVLVAALVTWSPLTDSRLARWDIPSFVVAHGVIGTALVVSVARDSVAPTFLAAGAVSVAVSVVIRQGHWAAAGAALTLIAAADAGPGWLTLALLVEGLALTVAGMRFSSVKRWVLLILGSSAIVGSWLSLAVWQSWTVPTVLYATAPGAATVSVCAAAALRSRRAPRELAVVWAVTGAVTAAAGATLVFHDDVARRPGGLTMAGTLLLVAIASGLSASVLGAALRWLAGAVLALAWVPVLWALEPSVGVVAIVATLAAVGLFVAILATAGAAPSSPWIGPAVLWAGATQLGGAIAAMDDLPNKDLLIVVTLALAAELTAMGLIGARPSLFVAAPASACTAWILYASDALTGEANWFTVPVGFTVLVMVGLIRWIRADRGGEVVGLDVVSLELVGMAFTVASPLARTLAGQLANALLAIAIGLVLIGWGMITKVRRRLGLGAAAVVLAVLFLMGVPLSDLAVVQGPGLWVTVIVIGLVAVAVATTIEQARDRLELIKHRLDEMTDGWERIGTSAAPKST